MNGLSIIFLRLKLSDWFKCQDPLLHCLLEMQLIYTVKDKLKVKIWRKKMLWRYHPKPGIAILIPEKAVFGAKNGITNKNGTVYHH